MNRKIGVLFSYLLLSLEMLSSILFTPFMIRSFGQAEYGVYSLVLSITTYLTLLDMGVGNALIRYFAKYKVTKDYEASRKLKGFVLIFYLIMAVVAIIIGIVVILFFSGIFSSGLSVEEIILSKKLLILTILNIVFTFIFTPYSKMLIAYEYFGISKIIDIIKLLSRVSISFLILFSGGKSLEITALNLCFTIVFGIITRFVTNHYIVIIPKFFSGDRAFFKEIFSYTFFLFLLMIASQINNMTDHVLLGIFTSSTIIAIYQVGAQITQYYQSIASAFNGVLQPGVVRMIDGDHATPEIIEEEMIRIGRIIFMVMSIIYVVFLVNGKSFIYLWVGPYYEKSYYVTLILIFPLLLILPQNIGSQILYALNKHKIQALLKALISVLNIFVSIILIKTLDSVIGAAIGTALAEIVGDYLVFNCIFKRELKINILRYNWYIIKRTTTCLLISLVVGIFVRCVIGNSGVLGFFINCTIMLSVYSSTMYFIGMNDYEKNLIKSLFKH